MFSALLFRAVLLLGAKVCIRVWKLTPEESDEVRSLLGFNGVLHLSAPSVSPLFHISAPTEGPLLTLSAQTVWIRRVWSQGLTQQWNGWYSRVPRVEGEKSNSETGEGRVRGAYRIKAGLSIKRSETVQYTRVSERL